MYYGIFESNINKSCRDLDNLKYTYKNKLCGPQQHPRSIIIERLAIQLEVINLHLEKF